MPPTRSAARGAASPRRPDAGRGPRSLPPAARLALGLLSVAAFLLLWEAAARRVGASLVLPGPLEVAREFRGLAREPGFLRAVAGTFLRGLFAFGLAVLAGSVTGFAAGLLPAVSALAAPLLTIVRATPVLAVILVALLWFPSGAVPVFSAVLMAFPVAFANAYGGARAADPRLLEMAELFGVPGWRRLLLLRLPAAAPQLLAGARASLGLSWKVVVAGEVLSQPTWALGTGMQAARIGLETPRVFAWALAAVALCGLSEWAFGLLAGRALRHDF